MIDTQVEQPTGKAAARAAAQRKRILRAARKCFVDRGFHAASMATIAQTADMSAGLIYRYFRSKNEIILAIIDEQLEVARARIGELSDAGELAAGIAAAFDSTSRGDGERLSAPLFLEMSAEATRDPQIASALRNFDATIRSEFARVLARSRCEGGYAVPKARAAGRALMFMCIFEGLKAREAREPHLDRKLLESALNDVLGGLFGPQ
ncbi:MAG: TetR/AcrR family transcriptional regulator [Steroidobacteraceae bacterium]